MAIGRGGAPTVEYLSVNHPQADATARTLHTLSVDKNSGYHYEICVDLAALLVAAYVWLELDVKGDGTFVEIQGQRKRWNPAGTTDEQAPAKHFDGLETARSIRLRIQSDTGGEAAARTIPGYVISDDLMR